MSRGRRSARRASRPGKLILLAVLGLGVAGLSLSTYLPRAFPGQFGAALNAPSALYREAGRTFVETKGKVPDETYERLAGALRRNPLDGEPLFFFGMRALAAGDQAGAERLLLEARQRDPRATDVRLALMALYLRTGRVGPGSAELATLVRVRRRTSDLLTNVLAGLAADPASRRSVEQAIGDQPIMADVLTLLLQRNVDPDVVLSLAARQPRPTDGRFAPWQEVLIAKMVERGDVSRAYDVWRRFAGVEQGPLVYDPEFSGAPGSKPFNWELATGAVGAAERVRGGGVELIYFGRRPGPLARQLLVLRPGRYQVSARAEGSATGQGSRIVLQVACRGRDGALLTLPLEDVSAAGRTIQGSFSVPSGCDSQWFGFMGEAAEFPNEQRARVTGLTLRPAGG